jgi:hypothetical protein
MNLSKILIASFATLAVVATAHAAPANQSAPNVAPVAKSENKMHGRHLGEDHKMQEKQAEAHTEKHMEKQKKAALHQEMQHGNAVKTLPGDKNIPEQNNH